MTTRTVNFYREVIAYESKLMPIKERITFHRNHSFTKEEQTKALLNGIVSAIQQYFQDEHAHLTERELPVVRISRRAHSVLLEDILRMIQPYGQSIPEDRVVKAVLKSLEQGVLEQRCNPKGNFANLCRAIVHEASEMPDWKFSGRFKDALGIKSIALTSIHGLSLD